MASRSSMFFFDKRNEDENVNQVMNIQQDLHVEPPADQPPIFLLKKRRNPPGVPYTDTEVIALSPTTLMTKNRFVCEVCHKGFPRDQNLQLHKRGHNLPWKLKQRSETEEVKRKVYLCPEPSCVNHDPSHALGDLTGIKKHYSRKHGEKKYKCQKCEKMYAVKSDLKAHSKTCGTKEYQCHCGTLFSRRDSFITHRAFCDALPQLGSQVPSTQNPTHNLSEINRKLNYLKSPPALFTQSSDQQTHHNYKQNLDTQFFNNLVNNTTTPNNDTQLYNFSFMGNHWNSGSGQGSSLFSSGMVQLSATGLLQKAAMLGSTSSTNSHVGNSGNGAHSNMNELLNSFSTSGVRSYCGGFDRGNPVYDNKWKTFNSVEQQSSQNSSFNMGFEEFSGVKMTRDFLGVGVEVVDNRSSDGPKHNFPGRSFL